MVYPEHLIYTEVLWKGYRTVLKHSDMKLTLMQCICYLVPSLLIKMLVDGRNFPILRYEEVILAYSWFGLNFMLTRTTCGLSNIYCSFALTVTEKNAFKDQNGVNCGSHTQNGAGWPLWMWFQPHFCITENFVLNCIKLKDATSHFQNVFARGFQVQFYGLKVSLVTMWPFWIPTNPCLMCTLTSHQFQS